MKKWLTFFGLLAAFLWGFSACSKKKKNDGPDKNVFCINDSLMKQVATDTVKFMQLENELRLSSKITFNEDNVVKVYPFAGGVIEDLKVELGDYVTKGQVLALIRSSEIVDFENQLISAKSNLEVAQKNLQVAEDMFKGLLTSERDVIMAKNEVQKAESEYKKIRQILQIYGEASQSSIYSVKAPISGYIVEKNVTENTQFRSDNAGNLFTISNLDNVWSLANVYESDIAKLKIGYDATVTTIAYPDKPFHGKIDKIFNVLDADSRVAKIKIPLENKENLLKPEMFAFVSIMYKEDRKLLCVPSKAVIFDKSKNYVIGYKDACNLTVKEINVYKSIKGTTYVNSGLKRGERVITENQLLIYNALSE